MAELLEEFGAETSYDGLTETIKICSETLSNQQAAEKNACAMRASFLAAGPLLARCHQAALPLPGGCPIGSRPVDLHLKGFSIMGAVHKLEHGVVELSAKNGLRGKRVYLDFPSVGATENIMMDAVKAGGDRQELHERIRELSMEAGRTVKVEGKDNNLLELIAADPAFNLTLEELEKTMEPSRYVGRAKEQTEVFLAKTVQPVLDAHKELLGVTAEINV